jgi:hypothetical protein
MVSIRSNTEPCRSSEGSITLTNISSTTSSPATSEFPNGQSTSEEVTEQPADDPEDDLDLPVSGWPRMAMLLAKTPDFAAFSRFRDLNTKSLLYYQSELTRLREKLHKQEYRDHRRGVGKMRFHAKRADYFIASGKKGESKQWALMLEIRGILREYSKSCRSNSPRRDFTNLKTIPKDEALLQYNQICNLPSPEPHNMRTLRTWLQGQHCIGGNGEENTWCDIYDPETPPSRSLIARLLTLIWRFLYPASPEGDINLVSTRPAQHIDGFTRWVADEWVPFYSEAKKGSRKRHAKKQGRDEEASGVQSSVSRPKRESRHKREFQKETLATYSERSMLRFTSSVSTVVACLLPTIAITVLSKIQDTNDLLLCVAGFAVVFSVGLMFLTSAATTRVEIFTATAA